MKKQNSPQETWETSTGLKCRWIPKWSRNNQTLSHLVHKNGGGIIHKEEFHTIKWGKDNIILRLPWLNCVYPTINWVNKHVDIHEATDQTKEYNLATSNKPFTIRKATKEPPTHPKLLPWEHEKEDPIYPDENFINYVRGVQYVYTKGINRFEMVNRKLWPLTIAKTSITSKLVQKTEEVQVTLPEEYAEYTEVFSEEASQKMPPSWSYDHSILLDETFVPKIGKVYPLSPDEQKATNDFIKENLRTGKIQPSPSPQVSSFFYVGKKDSRLRPCQDYHYINEHTIKDTYPLPLIPNLIDKVKDATIFTKFDIWSRYNNIRIKDRDQWKAAFITLKGLFGLTIMFFWAIQLPCHIPKFHEWLIQRYDSQRMADCLYGQHVNHCLQQTSKHRKNKESPSKNERTWPPPQTEEMQVWGQWGGFLRTYTSTWRNHHGPH